MTVTCKLGEKGCWNDGKCRATSNCENKVITNADRIRTMIQNITDEEFVEKFRYFMDDDKFCTGDCNEQNNCDLCRLAWLKQPAEE